MRCVSPWGDPEEGTVQGQERILRDRFAGNTCATCGTSHRAEDMLVLAQRDSRWLVLLTCRRCQRRGIFVASFPKSASSQHAHEATDVPTSIEAAFMGSPAEWLDPTVTPDSEQELDLIPPLWEEPTDTGPVTQADVDSITRFLDDFDGDFHSLFGRSDEITND